MINNIKNIIGLTNQINIFIHLTDFCNFSCKYCVLGEKLSGLFIGKQKVEEILLFIDKIIIKNKFKKIKIVISGGEPTLSNNFFYLIEQILKKRNKSIFIQITTNGFVLGNKKAKLLKLKKYSIKKLFFNISYHYFEYKTKKQIFIKYIKLLKELGYIFEINFLLPDNTKLSDFIKIFNYIRYKTNFNDNEFRFSLIRDLNGEVSENYNKEVLAFYNNSNFFTKTKKKEVKYLYEDGKSKDYSFQQIFDKKLNNYFGYKCHYINNNNINININADGSINFGICNTLIKLKYYNYKDIYNLIYKEGDSFVYCGEKRCNYKWELFLDKTYHKNKRYDKLLNKIYKKIFSLEFELIFLSFSQGNFIQYHLKKDNINIFYNIEKLDLSINYPFKSKKLGYHVFFKGNKLSILKKEKEFFNYLKDIFKFNKVFEKMIIYNKT